MDHVILMEWLAYITVGGTVASAGYYHWKNSWNTRPAKGIGTPYMVCGMDFTEFPRGATHAASIKWVKEKFKEGGKYRPTAALAEDCMTEYYTKYPSDRPTVSELRARNEA